MDNEKKSPTMQVLPKSTLPTPDFKLIERCGKSFYPWFHIVDQTRPLYELLWRWLYDIEGLRAMGHDPRRGFLLKGPFGTGKSVALRVLQQLGLRSSPIISSKLLRAEEAVAELRFDERNVFELYGRKLGESMLLLDDLGVENASTKIYGNEDHVVAQLLLTRYTLFQELGRITHATTNLTTEQLREHYGERVTDRMREMFNVVTLTGKSLRK